MLIAGLTLAVAAWLWAVSTGRLGVEGWRERASPIETTAAPLIALQARFAKAGGRVDASDYELLTTYFFEGWAAYRTPRAERAHYPGLPSTSGRRSDGLEGYARMFPLAAAWLASGRAPLIPTAKGPLDLAEVFGRGLVTGTDPASPDYWGPITDYSQTLVESADIALGLWLARKEVWARLSPLEQRQVIDRIGIKAAVHIGPLQSLLRQPRIHALHLTLAKTRHTMHQAFEPAGACVTLQLDRHDQIGAEQSRHRGSNKFIGRGDHDGRCALLSMVLHQLQRLGLDCGGNDFLDVAHVRRLRRSLALGQKCGGREGNVGIDIQGTSAVVAEKFFVLLIEVCTVHPAQGSRETAPGVVRVQG
jgi:hypothetical protein